MRVPVRFWYAMVVAAASWAGADELADNGRALAQKHDGALVTLRLTVKESYSAPAMGTEENESTVEAAAVVVGADGLAVASLSAVDPLSVEEDMMEEGGYEDEGVSFSSEITETRMVLSDGLEMPMHLTLRDLDLDLAVFRPLEAPAAPMSFIDLSQGGEAAMLDQVAMLSRLGKAANRAAAAYVSRVNAVPTKPRRFYVVLEAFSFIGCPTFTLDGRVLGIVTWRTIKSVSEVDSGTFWGDSQLPIVLPAAEVLEVMNQAREESAQASVPAEEEKKKTEAPQTREISGEKEKEMTRAELFRVRVALVQAYLQEKGYDGILLSRVDNFAMATGGGRNYVNIMGDVGVCALFIDKDARCFLIANTIESPRIMDEELAGLGVEPLNYLWFETDRADVVRQHFNGLFVSDDGTLGENVNADLAYMRSLLTPVELEKYRRLGKDAADAMVATLKAIKPGMPEAEISARLIAEGEKRRCLVPVALVAADERIAKYRHPLPTEAPLASDHLAEVAVKDYVMVVGCFQREGLVASLTRFKRVGTLPDGIADGYRRVAAVDAVMQEATTAYKTLGDVFAACQQAYPDFGFPANEWHNHHQGGTTGYGARTMKGSPGEGFAIGDRGYGKKIKALTGIDVQFGQAYAWNPSAKGVKSEDTFLLLPDGRREIVTATPALPQVDLASVLGRPTEVAKSGIAE